jgi:hypothetical protein
MFPARGRAVAAHRSHKPKVAGSNPALASNKYARPSERMHESGINGRATPPQRRRSAPGLITPETRFDSWTLSPLTNKESQWQQFAAKALKGM